MDLFDKESGSLYLTYDRFHNILHASREGEGTDGFLRHIHDDVSLILQEGHDPNVWFTYFEFPDKRDIPNLALKDMSLLKKETHPCQGVGSNLSLHPAAICSATQRSGTREDQLHIQTQSIRPAHAG